MNSSFHVLLLKSSFSFNTPITFPSFSITLFFFSLSQPIIFKSHFPYLKTIYSYPHPRFHSCTNLDTNLKIKLPIIINQLALSNLAVILFYLSFMLYPPSFSSSSSSGKKKTLIEYCCIGITKDLIT